MSTLACAQRQPAAESAPVQISEYPSAPYEDRQGNLWFSSAFEGVFRYDGTALIQFTEKDGLASNSVRGVMEDEDGVLWFGTSGGVSKYDGRSFETVTAYERYEGMNSASGFAGRGAHRDIWDLMRDRHGTFWITTLDGVFRHDGKSFTHFPLPVRGTKENYQFSPTMVYSIFEDDDGDLWFGTDGAGVVRYDGTDFTVYTVKEHGLASDRVCGFLQDAQGNYWICTADGGVSRFDGHSFTTHLRNTEFSESMGWGRFMGELKASDGRLWFGAAGPVRGAYRYDGTEFRFFSEKDGLGDGHIPSITEDSRGDVWFGTTAGVYRSDGETFVNVTRDGPWPEIKRPARPDDDPPEAEVDGAAADGPSVDALEGWASEVIALPPGFAPDLPTGVESVRFAPGWRDPDAEGFWSYSIVMWIDEGVPDAARIDELFEAYYSGLMNAVAGDRREEVRRDPVRASVVSAGPNRFEATVHLVDAFTTFKPIDVRLKVETEADGAGRSVVRVRASPQPDSHGIWGLLQAAIESTTRP